MTESSLLLRSLAAVRRRPAKSRVLVTDILWLSVGVVSLAIPIVFDWLHLVARFPWIVPVLIVLVYPWVDITMSQEHVVIRRHVGFVPLWRAEHLPTTGCFGAEQPDDDTDRVMIVVYRGGGFTFTSSVHVFCLFPRRLARTLNAELARVRGEGSGEAPAARVVKDE